MTTTTYYTYVPTSYYTSSCTGDECYVKRCLAEDYLKDIERKVLQNTNLTDEDADRVLECVEEKKQATNSVAVWVCIGLVALVAGLLVLGCLIT